MIKVITKEKEEYVILFLRRKKNELKPNDAY
jgi:hypothetical protein